MTNESYVEIPWSRLNETQRIAVVDAFILREGTDYGMVELNHETKSKRLIALLVSGRAHIIFDLKRESFNILTSEAWLRLKQVPKSSS